jgi:Zinc-uptake complex component A periplasmic
MALLVTLLFVSALIFLLPKNSTFNIDIITSSDKVKLPLRNEVITTNLAVSNILKTLSKGSNLSVNFIGPVSKLNDQNNFNTNNIESVNLSKGFVSVGDDRWLDFDKNKLTIPILDLSTLVEIKESSSKIDITFGDSVKLSSVSDSNLYVNDYSYLLDEKNLSTVTANIAEFLINIDQSEGGIFKNNSKEFMENISKVESQYFDLSKCTNKNLIATSDNLSYLASKYGLDQTVVKGFDPINPSLNQIKFIKSLAKSKNVKSLFIDKKIPLIELEGLKKNLDLNIYFIDYYSSPEIIETLQNNLQILKLAQNC